jgi:hypothetical protein
MVMIYRVTLLFALALSSSSIFAEGASDDAVRLLEFTPKHKTLILGKGHLDGLAPTHKGYLVMEDDGKFINLGRGEAVKVFAGYSVWSMEKPIDYRLEKNQIIYLRNQTEFYSHMPVLDVKRRKVIGERIDLDNLLSKDDDLYLENQEIDGKPEASPARRIVKDQADWNYRENEANEAEYVSHTTETNISNEEFKEKFETKRYADLVDGQNEEMTEDPVNLDKIHSPKITGSRQSTYSDINESRYQRDVRAQEALKEKRRKGLAWSDEMSDAELASFIKKNGIDYELKRRDYFMNKRHNMEFTLSLGFKLNNSTEISSPQAKNTINNDIALGLEYFLGAHSYYLDHFSVEGDLRRGSNQVYMTTANASLNEFTYGLNTYWYPFNLPGTIFKNLFFVGLGIRQGTVAAETTLDSSSYSALVLPVISTGIRYHFDNQIGLRLLANMETFNLSQTSQTSGQFPASTSYTNMKVVGGFSYYF